MSETLLIPVELILPNPEQPRTDFDAGELAALAASIKGRGLIQAITVEGPLSGNGKEGKYTLVDGERRLRATRLAGLATIRADVQAPRTEPAKEKLMDALVANCQRSDLNPIEEGRAYKKLQKHGCRIREIATLVGRSSASVQFKMKLLEFDGEIQNYFASKRLPMDPNVVYGMDKLPEDIRLMLVRKWVQGGCTATTIKQSITRAVNSLNRDKDAKPFTGKRAPAIRLSNDSDEEPSRLYKSLSKDGVVPAWELVERAAKETCDNCLLADMASTSTCGDCPAVELVKRLTKIATQEIAG